ncbi:hypothetical protein MEG1DRAFT_03630 [Photorhabdus temperata subsp. temperata Meg1]|uniref:Uncharacterized protein n=1 Tax=Photorhabdus temperata subsp. temperata Meg1 TaxID=1393735 RepID=A0A081RSV2_PHOTE|nr:hypothetical protein MEG1DRAFT_03630 [Photorhabdus temperata subsp. temperata Meg1]
MLKSKYSKKATKQVFKKWIGNYASTQLGFFLTRQRRAIADFLSLTKQQSFYLALIYYHLEIVDCYKCNMIFKLDANQKN